MSGRRLDKFRQRPWWWAVILMLLMLSPGLERPPASDKQAGEAQSVDDWWRGGGADLAGFRLESVAHAQARKILHIAEDSLPMSLNPLQNNTMVERRTLELIQDGLFNVGDTGVLEPSIIARNPTDRLAEFMPAQDGLSGEGRLSEKAFFHNGDPVTINDLKGTLLAYAASDSTSRFYKDLVRDVEPMQGDPLRQFRLLLKRPLKDPRYALSVKVMPIKGFRRPDAASWSTDREYTCQPIGAGPFKLVSKDLCQYGKASLLFQAHDKYHKGRPKLDQIEILSIPTALDKLAQLRSHQIDVIVSLSREDQNRARSYGATTVAYPIRNWWYLGFNCKRPMLDQPAVRQALSGIIDRESLGRKIGEVYQEGGMSDDDLAKLGNSVPSRNRRAAQTASVILVSGPFVASSPYYNRKVAHPVYDVDKAAQALLKLGSFKKKGATWHYRDKQVSLELVVDKSLPDSEAIMNQIKQDFLDFGIKVNGRLLNQAEWDAIVDPRGGGSGNGFDLVLGRWHFDSSDDIQPIFSSTGRLNYYRYTNPDVDQLLSQADAAVDFDQRAALMRKVHQILAEDMPCVFLWEANMVAAFAPRVTGFAIHGFSFYVNPHNWDVETEER